MAVEIATLEHGGSVRQVIACDDNKHAFTGGANGVKIWDFTKPEAPVAQIDCLVENGKSTPTWAMKLSKNGCWLLVGGWREKVYIVDVDKGATKIYSHLKTSAMACISLAFSRDGRLCYTGHNNGTIGVWDLQNQTLVRQLEEHSGYVNCIEESADGTQLWTGGDDKTVKLWDLREGKKIKQYDLQRSVECMDYCPSDDWLAVGLDNSKVEIFSGSKPDKHKIELDSWRINSIKFANSGKWFALTTERGMLGGFTAPAGPPIFTVQEKRDSTSSCDISEDGSHIVTGIWGTFGTMARVYQLEQFHFNTSYTS